VLYVLDRLFSASLGRSCAIQEEESVPLLLHSNPVVSSSLSFDLDLPTDCDDEYWDNEDPTKCFKQPEDVPSRLTAFILFIKLTRILSVTLRTIVSHKHANTKILTKKKKPILRSTPPPSVKSAGDIREANGRKRWSQN
jgi:hypothetical protein